MATNIKRLIEEYQKLKYPNGIKIITAYKGKRGIWGHFLCSCGTEFNWAAAPIKMNRKKSCGCMATGRKAQYWEKYNRKDYKYEYLCWAAIRNRCYLTTLKSYSYYGGRGIVVCDRWRNSFDNFIEDMGRRPSNGHSIDRIDVNGNYSPENCRWATVKEQNYNRTSNINITLDGVTKTTDEWAKEYKIRPGVLRGRMKAGWSALRALTEPLRETKRSIKWEE